MKKATFILLLLLLALPNYGCICQEDDNTVSYGPGVFAPDSPTQEIIVSPTSFPFKDCNITPLATFDIKAKVIAKENYHSGLEAELSPADLTLGWGKMSDESVLEYFDFSISDRGCIWSSKELPIPRTEVDGHVTHMAIIPADQSVEEMLERVREGDIVEFSGSLVKVDTNEGWHWGGSANITDTATDLAWVETFNILIY